MPCTHMWTLDELERAGPGVGMVWRCRLCGAVAYEASASDSGGVEGRIESRQPGVDDFRDQSDIG